MGWKAVRDHYGIDHIVSINTDGNLSISSAYISNIIVVRPDGKILEGFGKTDSKIINGLLDKFANEPGVIRSLLETPDTFSKSIPVYKCSRGVLVEKFCEKLGWPNCTHDGELMHNNVFYESKEDAVASGIRQCESWIELLDSQILQLRADLQNAVSEIAGYRSNLEILKSTSNRVEGS
jgi:hypothetical protein